MADERRAVVQVMREIRRQVVDRAENVGPRFAEEARRIHNDEAPERGIYGEATLQEARDLIDDGIAVLPLPPLPEDHH